MLDTFYEIAQWVIRLVMIPIVAREHRASNAIAWLAFILFLPVVGLVAYVLFGAYHLRRDVKGHARVRKELESAEHFATYEPYVIHPDVDSGQQSLMQVAEHLLPRRLGGLPILGGNAAELVHSFSQVMDRLVTDIEAAQHHVHLLFYHFEDDTTGWRVAEALASAAARGVRCRVLIDAYTSRSMWRSMRSWMTERHIELRTLLPVNPLRRPLARFDIRNHRKLVVLDGRIGYTGSQNIHDADWGIAGPGFWEQVVVRLTGPAVLQLQLVFFEDWYFATSTVLDDPELFPSVEITGDIPIHVVPDGPTYPSDTIQHLLVEALHTARRCAILTSPYFVPDEPVLLTLRLAALRGVEVHIVIPERSDRWSADTAARAYFQELLDVGVHIHLHQQGVLHAKTMSIDGTLAMVGSANIDRRSLYLNYELAVFLYSPALATALGDVQRRYMAHSRQVDREVWYHRPQHRQYLEHTVKLLSPLL